MKEDRTNLRARTKVVIATSNLATCAGIRMALTTHGFEIGAEASSVDGLLTEIDGTRPDACLLDIGLAGDALRAVRVLASRAPGTAVILLTDDESDAQFLEAMRLGAAGYLAKTIAPDALASAVRSVCNGEVAVPRGLVKLLINEYRERPARRYLAVAGAREAELTAREWEVLDCMRDGLSTREIAERLLISEVTVRRHIGAVVKKLDAENRADALKLLHSA
jgi:DNA-binding NarL/FixJ family response regulator